MTFPRSVFLTGATGLVGRGLMARLDGRDQLTVSALSRNLAAIRSPGVRLVNGCLNEPGAWADSLMGVTDFLHLAALTGKARPEEYERVNVDGTRIAIEQCQRAGVRRFLFVSTIATTYPDIRRYPYAQSKLRAEELVRTSGLDWTIVRPTIVLGRSAKLWNSFKGLAGLPLIPLFGDGRIRVQPIHVDDLAACLATWLDDPSLVGGTFDLGGPEVLEFRDMLARIHLRVRGGKARFLRIPLRGSMSVLSAVEGICLPLLPVTAGQLHAFRYPSTVQPNRWHDSQMKTMKSFDTMLTELLNHD